MRGLEATVSTQPRVGGETELERVLELVVKRARALVDAPSVRPAPDDRRRSSRRRGRRERRSGGSSGTRHAERGSPAARRPARRSQPADRARGPVGARLGDARDRGRARRCSSRCVRGARTSGCSRSSTASATVANSTRDDELAARLVRDQRRGRASRRRGRSRMRRCAYRSRPRERERQRWARELHDETLQELGALNVMQRERPPGRTTRTAMRARCSSRTSRSSEIDRRPAGADHRAAPRGAGPARDRRRGRGARRSRSRPQRPGGRTRPRPRPRVRAASRRGMSTGPRGDDLPRRSGGADQRRQARAGDVRVEGPSRRTDGPGRITVEDDGEGFDPESAPAMGSACSGCRSASSCRRRRARDRDAGRGRHPDPSELPARSAPRLPGGRTAAR